MVLRPAILPRPRSICHICDAVSGRRVYSTRPVRNPRNVARPQIRTRAGRSQSVLAGSLISRRLLASTAPSTGKTPPDLGDAQPTNEQHDDESQPTSESAGQRLSSAADIIAYLDSRVRVLVHKRAPSEAEVSTALQACRVVADVISGDPEHPQISHIVDHFDSTSSDLLSLDGTTGSRGSGSSTTAATSATALVKRTFNKISDIAYSIVARPSVFITPGLLQQYVDVQAHLGKPESLPRVFEMYASKPVPRDSPSGPASFVKQNPGRMANAIDPIVIEAALDAALEARNLDAAVGIVEHGYATKAFIRKKLLRQCALPLGTFAATPAAVYILAMNLSGLQNTMDSATATNVAFAGILAYVGITASIGLIAVTTANDQMRRVTWAPGIPLRSRWIREDERAALDKIACAWGFRETWRQGEEDGPDWDALREYIGQRGMILDRVELMEGMQ
ncbi:hypothetical protein GGS23DRAFT_413945 [Durotheca rogersii]|uniref:uncharacterized protein n=1 Tax=Durotheca rogersii TaxID=419775 RepID=UPI002220BC79|nr:uncharacterized protein GGS23DRAFT_413945 [Durotheca rogersii]KAI5865196.1 hypothetical protein GGS23DRAFT_413945 [Durotheca rogersii]